MFKIVATAAMAALLSSTAMAAGPVFKGGQFAGVTQYTGLVDPNNFCAGTAGLAAGQNTYAVATFPGLGLAWTSTIANPNPSPTAAYGVSWINCQFAALPAATAFVKTNIGTSAAPVYEYTYSPAPTAPAQVTSCLASNGTAYTLTTSTAQVSPTLFGSTAPTTEQQNLTITILPVNGAGADSGIRVTSTNSELSVGALGPICFLSTDALYLNTVK